MVPSPNKNPVFVPSPRWLSESPARPGTLTHIDFDGERTPSSQRSRDRSQTLWSPAPPPPANLYPGGAATFNVDPGVPFLATAGPTDAGSSEGGSIKEESPRDKRFVGGFVTGIKKAVRNSLRRSQRTEPPLPMYAQPPQFRDSGYAGSTSQLDPPPPIAPPRHVRSSSSPSYDSPARPPSETLVGHTTHHPKLHDRATVVGHQEIFPPEPMESPISAETVYGPDYIGMTPPHPESDTSLRSYLKRASKLVYEISALPWVAPERVTVDYYPERSKRCDEPERHPAIVWAHQNFSAHDYLQNHPGGLDLDSGSEMSSPIENFMAPRRRTSYGDMDPDDDFGEYDPEEQRSTYSSPHAEYFNRPPPSTWPDRDQYTPRPYTYDPTWAGATSQVQHPPVGLWQTVGTNPSPRQPSLQPQPRPPSQPTSHRSPPTPSRAQHRIPTPSMPPPRSAPPSDRGSWQQYPPEMGGYVPYEFAEHYYGDRYGPGVHAARPPVPGAHSSARTSMASVRDQQPPIPVGSSRV